MRFEVNPSGPRTLSPAPIPRTCCAGGTFAEFCEVYEVETEFAERIRTEFDRMLSVAMGASG